MALVVVVAVVVVENDVGSVKLQRERLTVSSIEFQRGSLSKLERNNSYLAITMQWLAVINLYREFDFHSRFRSVVLVALVVERVTVSSVYLQSGSL